jgi:hypothetical protein
MVLLDLQDRQALQVLQVPLVLQVLRELTVQLVQQVLLDLRVQLVLLVQALQ